MCTILVAPKNWTEFQIGQYEDGRLLLASGFFPACFSLLWPNLKLVLSLEHWELRSVSYCPPINKNTMGKALVCCLTPTLAAGPAVHSFIAFTTQKEHKCSTEPNPEICITKVQL